MTDRYPEIEPYDRGMLDVGDGNAIYWETNGNPAGKPAVIFHGGPGSGSSIGMRRFFDSDIYRIVLFDQRGSGRSTPHASDPAVDLSTNTTHHLIADIERLRHHLGFERWLVMGASWGTTLGLAYAEQFPARVSELILISVVTTTKREVEWVTRDMGRIFPEAWAQFRDGVPPPSATEASWTPTAACWKDWTRRRASKPPRTGAPGKTSTSPCSRGSNPPPDMLTRPSAWGSPAW